MDISNYNIEQCDAPSVLAAVLDAHDHPQKIDQIAAAISPIAAAAAAYSEGKPQLAQAITAKGVTTAADASLATMAQNVGKIVQSEINVQGGDMYKTQLFGSITTPNFWNLYEVLIQLLSYNSGQWGSSPYAEVFGGNSYVGIILAEYPKGDASIALGGAISASAYITSDGAAYTDGTTHTWNDDLDGRGNRWVAFLFGSVTTWSIDSLAVCPLSIYIGGTVGTISYTASVAGRISEIVVPDLKDAQGNVIPCELESLALGTSYTQAWNKHLIIRNIKSQSSRFIGSIPTNVSTIYLQIKNITGSIIGPVTASSASTIIIESETINITGSYGVIYPNIWRMPYIVIKANSIVGNVAHAGFNNNTPGAKFVSIIAESVTPYGSNKTLAGFYILEKMYIGYITNDSTKSVKIGNDGYTTTLTDVELQVGYKKNLDISTLTASLTAENIALHMLDKLATNDTGGTLTLKLGSTNLATITNDTTYSSYLTAATNKGWSVIA